MQFVLARIHRLNRGSQRLCSSVGFEYLEAYTADLQYWNLVVEL
jgi:hypothetical protein